MTLRRLRKLIALPGVLILTSAGPVNALDLGAWVPGLRVTPFLSQRVIYETNIFGTPNGAQDDLIFNTSPGALAEWVSGPNSLSAGYRAEILNFLTLTSQDRTNHYLVGQLHLELSRLRVDVRDDFANTLTPPTTELTGPIPNTTNLLVPEIEYRVTPRLGVGGNALWRHVNVPGFTELNREEYLVGPSVFWKAFPKANIQFSYDHGQTFFEGTSFRDVTRDLFLIGVRGELTAKLMSTFRIGYERRLPQTAGLPAYNGLVMSGDWTYKPTERLTLTLATSRSVEESTFGSEIFYVATAGTITANYEFRPKVTMTMRVSAAGNAYPRKESLNGETKTRNDTLVGWGGGIGYDIQPWIRVGVDYGHIGRFSNFRVFDYQDDKLTIFATLQM